MSGTDLDDWKAFLSRFGVEFDEFGHEGVEGAKWHERTPKTATVLHVRQGDRVQGWANFFLEVEFDAAGRFVQIGIWE